jgi:hypothetical protein
VGRFGSGTGGGGGKNSRPEWEVKPLFGFCHYTSAGTLQVTSPLDFPYLPSRNSSRPYCGP